MYSHQGVPCLSTRDALDTKKVERSINDRQRGAQLKLPNPMSVAYYVLCPDLVGHELLGCSSVLLNVMGGDDVLGNLIVASMVAVRS